MSVYKRTREDGTESKFYYYKFEYKGRTVRQCAETSDKKVALAREKEARAHAVAGRWNELRKMGVRSSSSNARIGDILNTYKEKGTVTSLTVIKNISALRCLLKVAYPETELEQLPVSALTARAVREYRSAQLAAAGEDKIAQERAKTTINSNYRNARSIFNEEMLQIYTDAGLDLGDGIEEFRSVPMLTVASRQYKRPSNELLAKLLRAAFHGDPDKEEKPLRETDPNAFKAFLMALGLGLRKNAASHARYSWITEQKVASIATVMLELQGAKAGAPQAVQRVLMVQIEDDFRPKGRDEQTIPMDDFIHSELEALRVPTADPNAPQYILHGHLTERTDLVWRRLSEWMQALGWDRRMQAHELRKLYGSEVASSHGLYAAQKLLGHKDANITSARYADMTSIPDVRIFKK